MSIPCNDTSSLTIKDLEKVTKEIAIRSVKIIGVLVLRVCGGGKGGKAV